MICLEMLSIRTAGVAEAEKVLDICDQFCVSAINESLKMTIFRNVRYPTDISIHLRWDSNPDNDGILGRQMKSELESLGLVNHTIWIQEEPHSGVSEVAAARGIRKK